MAMFEMHGVASATVRHFDASDRHPSFSVVTLTEDRAGNAEVKLFLDDRTQAEALVAIFAKATAKSEAA